MAWAIPQAIERSVATPTIRARLPARNPMVVPPGSIMPEVALRRSGSGVPDDVDAQLLAGVQMGRRAQPVPGQELRHAALEELGDLRDGIARAHGVDDVPVGACVRGPARAR